MDLIKILGVEKNTQSLCFHKSVISPMHQTSRMRGLEAYPIKKI